MFPLYFLSEGSNVAAGSALGPILAGAQATLLMKILLAIIAFLISSLILPVRDDVPEAVKDGFSK